MPPKRDNPEIEQRIEMVGEWIYAISLQRGWNIVSAISACTEAAKRVQKEADDSMQSRRKEKPHG